jgi:error-prone DNA polymerase
LAQARLLIKSRCFEEIEPHLSRPALLWRAHARHKREMFPELPQPAEYSTDEKLFHEIDCFGFLFSCHPLNLYVTDTLGLRIIQAADLPQYLGRSVRVLGWLINEKLTQTRNGEAMEFVTFEDQTAIYEATFFPQTFRRLWHVISANCPLIISGVVEQEFGDITVRVTQLNRLDVVRSRCYLEDSGDRNSVRESFRTPIPTGEAHA